MKRRVALKLCKMCRVSSSVCVYRGKNGGYFLIGALIFNSGFPCVVPELSLFHKMISYALICVISKPSQKAWFWFSSAKDSLNRTITWSLLNISGL